MGRSPCCAKEGLNRGAWTAHEDKILTEYIKNHGEGNWRHLPKRAGLKRCGKSCRLRWLNYLRPDIKRGNITHDEEDLIIRLHKLLGNRWSLIAGRLPGRTDNEIKNYWNTYIWKKLQNGNKEVGSTSSSLAGQESDPDPELDLKPEPPCLIITKATRCTKVMLTQELQPLMTTEHPSSTDPHLMNNNNVTCNDDDDDEKTMESPHSFEDSEGITNNLSLDFMVDFEIDESMFADLMNMDMSPSEPSWLENGVVAVEADDNNSNASTTSGEQQGCHHLLSPPTISNDGTFVNVSDDSILLSYETFQSMSAVVENEEFDWL